LQKKIKVFISKNNPETKKGTEVSSTVYRPWGSYTGA